MAPEIKRFSFIDALRGYAILGVIVVHVAQYVPKLEWPLSVIAIEGARGVQLFFIASALTLMLSWHSRSDGVAAFYIRRVFRIAPMFWLAIPLFISLDGLGIVWPHILATALFVHGFHPQTIDSIVPGGWTIGVEMTFYAAFPLLAWWIRSWQVAALAFVASVLGAALLYPITIEIFAALTPDQSYEQIKGFSFLWFPTQLPAFLMGILVFQLLRQTQPATASRDPGCRSYSRHCGCRGAAVGDELDEVPVRGLSVRFRAVGPVSRQRRRTAPGEPRRSDISERSAIVRISGILRCCE